MAHDIATIAGRDAVAYLGATPWHQLGTPLNGTENVAAALAAACLDWRVKLQEMYYRDPATGNFRVVENRRVVIRDVDGQCLGNVGGNYTPVQNYDAFAGILEEAVARYGVTIESAGALGRGEQVWMLARLPESFEPTPGDRIDPYVLISTGHDGATPFTARPTTIRVVCRNTLDLALGSREATIRLAHVSTAPAKLAAATALVRDTLAVMEDARKSFARLAETRWTRAEATEFFHEVLDLPPADASPAALNKVNRLVELFATGTGVEYAPESAWAALNALTEYLDHDRAAAAATPKRLLSAANSAIFGNGAWQKARALRVAVRRTAS